MDERIYSLKLVERLLNNEASPVDYFIGLKAVQTSDEVFDVIASSAEDNNNEDAELWANLYSKYHDEIEDFARQKTIRFPQEREFKVAAIKK